MDAGLLRGLFTLFMFLAFLGIVLWAYSSRRKDDFDEAANLPLQDDELISTGTQADSKSPSGASGQ
jgi:cytochrome c oxidase cbb3-type subunit 4